MSDKPDPTISEKIENAVEGLLRFGSRMFNTSWLMLRHPLRCGDILLQADRVEKRYVLPLSYLTIGGFIFTLVIAVYPFGILNILDLIWFDDDISRNIYQNFASAFSITGLLTAAFPVFFSVTIITYLAQHVLVEADSRDDFAMISYYLFGYQALFFFIVLFSLLFLDVLISAINGPYVEELLDEALQVLIVNIIFVALFVIWVSAIITPAFALTYWRFRAWKAHKTKAGFLRVAAMPLYAILMLTVTSYAASLPSVLKDKVANDPVRVELDFIGDLSINMAGNLSDGYVAAVTIDLIIDNAPDAILVTEKRNVSLFIELEPESGETERFFAAKTTLEEHGQPVQFIHIDRKQSKVYRISGNIDLTETEIALIRAKADGEGESNSYDFLAGVELSRGSDRFTRHVSLSESDAIASLK